MPFFPLFRSSFLLYVDVRVTCSHACMMSLVMLCSNLCVCVLLPCFTLRYTSVHGYMFGSMFYHVYVLDYALFACTFLCLYV